MPASRLHLRSHLARKAPDRQLERRKLCGAAVLGTTSAVLGTASAVLGTACAASSVCGTVASSGSRETDAQHIGEASLLRRCPISCRLLRRCLPCRCLLGSRLRRRVRRRLLRRRLCCHRHALRRRRRRRRLRLLRRRRLRLLRLLRCGDHHWRRRSRRRLGHRLSTYHQDRVRRRGHVGGGWRAHRE